MLVTRKNWLNRISTDSLDTIKEEDSEFVLVFTTTLRSGIKPNEVQTKMNRWLSERDSGTPIPIWNIL